MTQNKFLIALSAFTYFGPARAKLLVDYFGSANKAWKSTINDLIKLGVKETKALEFDVFRKNFSVDGYLEKLKQLDITVFSQDDTGYPRNLKAIPDAPLVLYVKGEVKSVDDFSVAVVGSRMISKYGAIAADKIATELAGYGVTVVSGLALGIDAVAHGAAITAGGRTIAVLATGLDTVTPRTNFALAEQIIKGRGALVSEKPLGYVPFKQDFAVRNRLISGLSKGVVVVEARLGSGTFHTVNSAASQGRPVFAIPGQITSPNSEAPHYLIQNGAKLTTGAMDILSELGWDERVKKVNKTHVFSKEEEAILQILSVGEVHLDELVRISGAQTGELSARLTIMEMNGLVKSCGGVYRKI